MNRITIFSDSSDIFFDIINDMLCQKCEISGSPNDFKKN